MNPNNQTPFTPAEYLDQIAPQTQNRNPFSGNKPLLITAIIGAVTVVLFIILLIINSFGSSVTTDTLAARLVNTSTVATDATSKIKSSQLKAINSNLKIYLTNTIRDITPILEKQNININKLNDKVIAAESIDDLTQALEDARLNVVFDRVYAREMAYRLDTIITLMKKIYNETSSDSLKTFLNTAHENLTPLQQQFADFNATNL